MLPCMCKGLAKRVISTPSKKGEKYIKKQNPHATCQILSKNTPFANIPKIQRLLSPSRSSRQRVIKGFISSSQLRAASRAQPWKFATKSPSW
jgi:hypothetical protein